VLQSYVDDFWDWRRTRTVLFLLDEAKLKDGLRNKPRVLQLLMALEFMKTD